jgi:carboxypeptidase C (cathepsin A)
MKWKQVCRILLLCLLLWPASGGAEEKKAEEQKAEAEKAATQEKLRKSRGTATIAGRRIEYTATAGTILLKDQDGQPKASIFFIAYSRDGAGEPAARPVTFAFNGGPGSSSVWLHLGALGPRRVMLGQEAVPEPPPYRLQNNEYSLLDLTDLVFIDPVNTGFSRAAPGEDAKQFHQVEKDIESVAEFIRLWITSNGRWASPKYVIGESYGATRAAGLHFPETPRSGSNSRSRTPAPCNWDGRSAAPSLRPRPSPPSAPASPPSRPAPWCLRSSVADRGGCKPAPAPRTNSATGC